MKYHGVSKYSLKCMQSNIFQETFFLRQINNNRSEKGRFQNVCLFTFVYSGSAYWK